MHRATACSACVPHLSVQVPAALPLIQFPAEAPGKTVEDDSGAWTPGSQAGDLVGGPDLNDHQASVTIWAVTIWVPDFGLSQP